MVFFPEQRVEDRDKIGEYTQKDLIEISEQLLLFLFQLDIINDKLYILEFSVGDFLIQGLFKPFELDKKLGVKAEEIADIFLLDLIGLFQLFIDEVLGGMCLCQ